jgi:serine/threonine protein kinase
MQCRDCNANLPPEARFCLSCGTRVAVVSPDPETDPLFETLNKAIGFQYRIERRLGRATRAQDVLGASDEAVHERIAVSNPSLELANTPQMQERFRREARIAAQLSHPHIVRFIRLAKYRAVYFVMGYVPGEFSLRLA